METEDPGRLRAETERRGLRVGSVRAAGEERAGSGDPGRGSPFAAAALRGSPRG